MGRPPIVISPYDAELYGHWWYEGPQFLDFFIRKAVHDQDTFQLTTPAEYLTSEPVQQVAMPSTSSWGDKGYAEFWLNETNDWVYPHLHHAADKMVELARSFDVNGHSLTERALNQCARELLLAQSSDWAFIMKTGTMVEYAVKRTRSHIQRFHKLYDEILAGKIDEAWLAKCEYLDNIFPELNYRIYR
jgi:1,4-alpha-glucan branching enzyme